jgi:Tfp pilus assembly protein FimT
MIRARGTSLVELCVVVLCVLLAVLLAAPALGEFGAELRTAAAARRLRATFHELRWLSVTRGRSHGLLFGADDGGWYWYRVVDRNGNGLRTSEVRAGVDATLSGPHRLGDDVPHVDFGFPDRGPYPRIPPSKGWLEGSDPVRSGASDLVAFAPLGSSTSGSFYVTDGRRRLYAVVLYGGTGRVRVWRWNQRSATWSS